MKKIGIIGFGNLGSAIAIGLKNQGFEVGISEEKSERAELASKNHKLKVFSEKKDLLESSEITIIAVKPQELDPLLDELEGIGENKELVSVIAGRKMSCIADRLKPRSMARFMPNLAATVGKALVGVAFGPGAREAFKTGCLEVARAIGSPCEVPESLMPAITGLSGSGIAYVFSFIHAMALGGVKTGIAYPMAVDMVLSIIEGALEVVRESGENPTEWLNRVISPAGTTIQGIAALEENGFTAGVMEAVERATDRAKELEG